MTEFQLSEQQQDLESLKNFIPSWENDKVEPFIHDTPVIPPTWNKVRLDQDFLTSGDGQGNANLDLVPVIAGRENGSTFTPCIVNTIGPAEDL